MKLTIMAALIVITLMGMSDELNSWGRKWVEQGEFDKAETCFNTAMLINGSALTLTLVILAVFVNYLVRKPLA